jgi:putative transposase
MKKSKFTETQIITMLKEHESGKKTSDICREQGISQATFYKWQSKYSGLEVNELKRMRDLEAENARLKKMYAEVSMDNYVLKDLITKKGWGPVPKKNS